ncbi:hypothetical protein OAP56_00155 [Rickettsiaceae bacterium]|nr:hypothetical protein [Rickettsiaceae bacterium]
MIVNNNFRMKAIFIGGVVGLLVAVGANHLLPKSNTQSQPASPNSKIEKKVPAFVVSSSNPLLHLKTTILKAASDAQEFTRMIGRNEHADQMIIIDALAKSIKKESTPDISHTGLPNEAPHALKYGNAIRLATTAEVLDIETQKLIEKLEQIARDINEAAYRE